MSWPRWRRETAFAGSAPGELGAAGPLARGRGRTGGRCATAPRADELFRPEQDPVPRLRVAGPPRTPRGPLLLSRRGRAGPRGAGLRRGELPVPHGEVRTFAVAPHPAHHLRLAQ